MSRDQIPWVYVKPPQRIEFLGEVKHRLVSPSEREVEIIVKPDESLGFELALSGLALDGSKSMLRSYAAHLPKLIRRKKNEVHPVAQDLAAFLAKNSGNKCAIAYWACGDDGSEIEPVGIMGTNDIQAYEFAGTPNWGGGTKLTPIVRYFWEHVFTGAEKQCLAVILTDGAWDDDDHERLIEFTETMCQEVVAARRQLMKCVVVGIKTEDNKNEVDRIDARFEELNNYESPTEIDVWDTKWVDEIDSWIELFFELVKEWSLGTGGFIEAQGQRICQQDEFTFGIQFIVPANTTSFVIHIDGLGDYAQEIV